MSKAWMDVPPTQSVPGTEDDERFYLPQMEVKARAKRYIEENHAHIREVARRWYIRNRDRAIRDSSDWKKRHRERVRDTNNRRYRNGRM